MRRFIFIVLLLVVSVWLGIHIAQDPGLALFQYRDWSVEMPLWFATLIFAVFIFLLYILHRFLEGIDISLYRYKNWLRLRRKSKSYNKMNRGILELIEGNWKNAENYFLDGIDQSEAPLINFLGASKAAHERGLFEKRDIYLRQAYDLAPEADVVIGIMQAQFQLNQGQLESALATLNNLRNKVPRHPMVLKLLERVYIHLADWKGLLSLLPSLRKAKVFTTSQIDNLEMHIYEEILKAYKNKSDNLQQLHIVWNSVPRKLQKDPNVIYSYVQCLAKYPGTEEESEYLINKTLNKQWNENLVRFYGSLNTKSPQKQLTHAEKWLEEYPSQAALFLTLARLSIRCQLWGKARSYYEESYQLEPHLKTQFEYGKLLEKLGDSTSALKIYREALSAT